LLLQQTFCRRFFFKNTAPPLFSLDSEKFQSSFLCKSAQEISGFLFVWELN
jgi:hypothetical protein